MDHKAVSHIDNLFDNSNTILQQLCKHDLIFSTLRPKFIAKWHWKFHYLSQNNSKYPIQATFLVYDFFAAPLLSQIGTFCVPTEVESGFGILSQNRDCPT